MLRVTGHDGAKRATLLEKGNMEAPAVYKFGSYPFVATFSLCTKDQRQGLEDFLFWAQKPKHAVL